MECIHATLRVLPCAEDDGCVWFAGSLTCIPNAKNPRDLDISIQYDFVGQNGEAHNEQKYRMR